MDCPVDWIVFDIGGVLVDVAATDAMAQTLVASRGGSYEALKSRLHAHFDWHSRSPTERFQTGEIDVDSYRRQLNFCLGEPLDHEAMITILDSMLLGVKTATERLVARLAGRGVALACFSNTNAVHWSILRARYDFFGYFQQAFASHELGLAKPDRRAFEAVAAALGAAPERCLLVDDLPLNVDGARRSGWQARGFENAERLGGELAALGLDTGACP